MIEKTHMTIAMYLRDAGIGAADAAAVKRLNPLKPATGTGFSEGLSTAMSMNRSGSGDKAAGLTIAEYRKHAVSLAQSADFHDPVIRNGWFSALDSNRNNDSLPPSTNESVAATPVHARSDPAAGTGTATGTERQITDGIEKAAKKYNLPEKLIKSVIRTESNFQPDAVSPAGAQGLMQLMPATARELGVNDPFDIQQNIDGGAAYLRQMLDRFGQNLRLALAAYNAGPGTVEKYNGVVPFRETREYVDRVLKGADV
jgi:soluble lytic murein transglycosylase-like protein